MRTEFAPADRETPEVWSLQADALARHPLVAILLDALGGAMVILNGKRQVVATNPGFLTLLGEQSSAFEPGRRLGELLACRNARGEGGCGTSALCAECGSVLAVLDVLERTETSQRDCHLSSVVDGRPVSREFRVKASPLNLNELFVIVTFADISAEKRREFFEQAFFHDLRNLLGGITGFSELLAQERSDRITHALVRLSRTLNSEVEAQLMLTRAEAGDFVPQREHFSTDALFQDLFELFSEHACARKKTLRIVPGAALPVHSDRLAVYRILVNMVKNAFEASAPGDEVTLEATPFSPFLRFTVGNPGTIPSSVARRIFERTFSTKNQPGRGLGTYAMRLFAEGYLGGRVSFTSQPDGTKFFLDLPAH